MVDLFVEDLMKERAGLEIERQREAIVEEKGARELFQEMDRG